MPENFTLESAFGSVTPLHRPEDFEELARLAKDERAEQLARKTRDDDPPHGDGAAGRDPSLPDERP